MKRYIIFLCFVGYSKVAENILGCSGSLFWQKYTKCLRVQDQMNPNSNPDRYACACE